MRSFVGYPLTALGALALSGLLGACGGDDGASSPDASPDVAAAADTVVYVVRHAETTGAGTDPMLSPAGLARAQALATQLAGAHVVAIYTSQYHRTHDTAIPTSTASGVAIVDRTVDGTNATTYGTELAALANAQRGKGDVLIVGHSNTVPDTVLAIAQMSIPAIADTEYNRFYAITLASDGPHLVSSTY